MDANKFLQFVTASALGNKAIALSIAKSNAVESKKNLDEILHEYAQEAAKQNSINAFSMATKLLAVVKNV